MCEREEQLYRMNIENGKVQGLYLLSHILYIPYASVLVKILVDWVLLLELGMQLLKKVIKCPVVDHLVLTRRRAYCCEMKVPDC